MLGLSPIARGSTATPLHHGRRPSRWLDTLQPKDTHIQTLPFLRLKGAETPTFTPPHQPSMATCIDRSLHHLGSTAPLRPNRRYHHPRHLLLRPQGGSGDQTSPGPYRGSHGSSACHATSCPYTNVPSPGICHGSMALQSGGRSIHRRRPLVGHDTLTIRLLVL
jgi:hypothetical protein